MRSGSVELIVTALAGIPKVAPGADLAGLLIAALEANGASRGSARHRGGDQQDRVEGRGAVRGPRQAGARRAGARAGRRSRARTRAWSKRPAGAEEVLRAKPNVLIVATRHGLIMANAGIDQSNLDADDHGRRVLLLPEDPDASAQRLKERLDAHFHADIGVIISDSVGRPWRLGTVGIAIGAAGVPSLWDRRGEKDLSGPATGGDRGRALPMRSPPSPCWPWARPPRGDRRRWCAGSTGRASGARPRPWCGPRRGPVPMSARPGRQLCGALRRQSAAPSSPLGLARCWASALPSSSTPATTSIHLGLHISPDVDTVLYSLAGVVNEETGWGRREETWTFMARWASSAGRRGSGWATAILRRMSSARGACSAGETLTAVGARARRALGIARAHPAHERRSRCARWWRPMRAPSASRNTSCASSAGQWCARIRFDGRRRGAADRCRCWRRCRRRTWPASSSVRRTLGSASIRSWPCPACARRCGRARAPIIAVSPIVGGKAVKGPTAKIMAELGLQPTAAAIARHYGDSSTASSSTRPDWALADGHCRFPLIVTNTMMRTLDDKIALARQCLAFCGRLAAAARQGQRP